MNFKSTSIPGVTIITPYVNNDERGHFLESYRSDLFKKNHLSVASSIGGTNRSSGDTMVNNCPRS